MAHKGHFGAVVAAKRDNNVPTFKKASGIINFGANPLREGEIMHSFLCYTLARVNPSSARNSFSLLGGVFMASSPVLVLKNRQQGGIK